jgi:glycosyltransferase involved in cell wall biosynthesis
MRLEEYLSRKTNDYSELGRLFYNKTGESIHETVTGTTASELHDVSVSIIIPCYNSESTLETLLCSIESQSFDKENMEIIVVDDASTDGSHESLEKYLPRCTFESILLRHKENLGRATARNSGAYLARNDVLVFLDSDVIIPENFIYSHAIKHMMLDNILLTSMRESIEGSSALYGELKQNGFRFRAKKEGDWRYQAELDDGTTISNVLDTSYWRDFGDHRRYISKTLPEMCISTAMSIRKDRFFDIGGFYQGFRGWGREDVLLGAMAIADGLFIVPELTTVYQVRRTSQQEENAKKQELRTNMTLYEALLQKDAEKLRHSNQVTLFDFYNRPRCIRKFSSEERVSQASVIIPVYDDERLGRCLESLSVQSIGKQNYEIIVVENGPEQRFRELSEQYAARYAYLPEANMPRARNQGLDRATFDRIVFTDADCVLPYYWLEEMIRGLNKSRIVGGPIKNLPGDTGFLSRYGQPVCHGQSALNYLPILDLPYVAGANSGFYKTDLMRAGGYDESLLSGNDVDLCYRLGLLGIRPAIMPRAGIFHQERQRIRDYYRRFYKYAVFQSALFRKYRGISGRRFFVNHYPFERLIKGVADTVAGSIKNDRTRISRGLADLIEGAGLMAGYLYGIIKHGVIFIP